MPQIMPAPGKPLVDLSVWAESTGNAAYIQLIESNMDKIKASQFVSDPAYMAMVDQFLAETGQTVQE